MANERQFFEAKEEINDHMLEIARRHDLNALEVIQIFSMITTDLSKLARNKHKEALKSS